MNDSYRPKGFVVARKGEYLTLFEFSSTEEWSNLIKWLEQKEFKNFYAPPLPGWDKLIEAIMSLGSRETIKPMDLQQTEFPFAPRCPVHGTPMKKDQFKKGKWYCNQRVDDGYCKERAGGKGQ